MRSFGRGLGSGSDEAEDTDVNEERDEPESRVACRGGVCRQTLSTGDVELEPGDHNGGVGSGRYERTSAGCTNVRWGGGILGRGRGVVDILLD